MPPRRLGAVVKFQTFQVRWLKWTYWNSPDRIWPHELGLDVRVMANAMKVASLHNAWQTALAWRSNAESKRGSVTRHYLRPRNRSTIAARNLAGVAANSRSQPRNAGRVFA